MKKPTRAAEIMAPVWEHVQVGCKLAPYGPRFCETTQRGLAPRPAGTWTCPVRALAWVALRVPKPPLPAEMGSHVIDAGSRVSPVPLADIENSPDPESGLHVGDGIVDLGQRSTLCNQGIEIESV